MYTKKILYIIVRVFEDGFRINVIEYYFLLRNREGEGREMW
jgi:hypothetical protein